MTASPPAGDDGRLSARDLHLAYRSPADDAIPVLDGVSLEVSPGQAVGLTGPSGAGKTSLLYILTGIERPQRGEVRWGGVAVSGLAEGRRDRWRRRHVGLVFQDFHLLPGLSILDNVLLPDSFERLRPSPASRRSALDLLQRVDAPPPDRDVRLLSRGEQQRVALARALLRRPPILAADEPTASLDAASGARVIELLTGLARAAGTTLIVVSHDAALLDRMDAVHVLRDGRLHPAPG